MFDIHPNWKDPYYDPPLCRICGSYLEKDEEVFCIICEAEEEE